MEGRTLGPRGRSGRPALRVGPARPTRDAWLRLASHAAASRGGPGLAWPEALSPALSPRGAGDEAGAAGLHDAASAPFRSGLIDLVFRTGDMSSSKGDEFLCQCERRGFAHLLSRRTDPAACASGASAGAAWRCRGAARGPRGSGASSSCCGSLRDVNGNFQKPLRPES